MQILRTGGRYASGRAQRLWVALIIVLALGAGAAALFPHPLVWIILGLLVTMQATKIGWRLASVRKGILGERLVTDLLGQLPNEYFLVNDVELPGTGGNADHALVGPCGVLVIETKRVAGNIRCDGDYWYVNGRGRKSISGQVNRMALAVKEHLSRKHPDLAGSTLRYVEGIVVFTNPLCRLDSNRSKAIVACYSELLRVVLEISRRKHVEPAIAERLARSLAAGQR